MLSISESANWKPAVPVPGIEPTDTLARGSRDRVTLKKSHTLIRARWDRTGKRADLYTNGMVNPT